MKKYLLLSILCIIPAFFYAQSYPSLTDNPVWTIEQWNESKQISTGTTDTLINNQHWTPFVNFGSTVSGLHNFYYREENQRVYIRMEGTDSGREEYLMYDFSLEAGDSVYIGIPGTVFPTSPDTVLYAIWETDSVFINNTIRKRMTVACYVMGFSASTSFSYLTTWIEGIGDTRVAFPAIFCLDSSDDSGICGGCADCNSFDCLQTNDGIIFSSGENAFCSNDTINLSRIYVNKNVESTAQNGSSWQYAFDDLQEAIEIAEDGDTIWVAQGTYYPTSGTNREVFFNLNLGVKIYGGFAATENTLAERDWENNPTILNGDIGVQGDSTDNSYHVVYTIGTDSTAVLDGFTLTRGYAIHPDNAYFHHLVRGGGMIVDTNEEYPEASPSIRNCNFVLNVAKHGGGLACNGVNDRYANPNIYNCSFYNNSGSIEGGAIYKTGRSHEENPQRIENCIFENNWAWQGGGGIAFTAVCNRYYFKDCTFLNNTTNLGGGGIHFYTFCDNAAVTMDNCFFEGNIGNSGGAFAFFDASTSLIPAEGFNFKFNACQFVKNSVWNGDGGAIHIGTWHSIGSIQIDNCIFDENHSPNNGGAIDIYTSSGGEAFTEINRSVFSNNYSLYSQGGGALSFRGYIGSTVLSRNSATVKNTLFYNNKGAFLIVPSPSGLGVSEIDVAHCTFYNNDAFPIAKNWSPNFDDENYYTRMSLSNCIIWEPGISLKNMFYNGNPNNQHLYDYTINNCLIPQSACDLPGGEEACNDGMLFAQNPMFVDGDNGDLRVGACSPAINAGDNMYSAGINEDIDGNPRILEAITDIGAYERPSFVMNVAGVDSVTCPGDADGAAFFESNGDLPYTYLWEMGILVDTTATNLAVGEYDFTVTDAAGCEGVLSLNIPGVDTLQVDYTIQHASHIDAQDGALTLDNITGGTAPYSWLWNTEDTTSSLDNLFTGWYILNIIDANDCVSTFNFEVSFPDATNDLPTDERPILQPNPVGNGENIYLIFSKNNAENHLIECFNASGLQLKYLPQNKEGNKVTFDTTALAAGLYFIKVSNEVGQFHIFRVVVL